MINCPLKNQYENLQNSANIYSVQYDYKPQPCYEGIKKIDYCLLEQEMGGENFNGLFDITIIFYNKS